MTFSLPPIVKLAERLLVAIEEAVRRFPRYYKYSVGADLRTSAMKVCRLTHRAWRDRARQTEWISRLVWAIDDLKINLQLGSRVKAFVSFAQFEAIARLAADLGKQAGGWNKCNAPRGQNGKASMPSQRAQVLSTEAASLVEAKP